MRPCTPFFCLFLSASATSPSTMSFGVTFRSIRSTTKKGNALDVLAFLLALGFLSVAHANVKAIEASFALLRRKFGQRDTPIRNSVTHRLRLVHLIPTALLALAMLPYAEAQLASASINFGVVNIGNTSSTQTATYTFSSAATLNGVSVPTLGISGRDFKDAGTGSYKANNSYSAGNSCTVVVSLAPPWQGHGIALSFSWAALGVPLRVVALHFREVSPMLKFRGVDVQDIVLLTSFLPVH